MKTLFKTFAYAAIAALALSSCAKEKLQPADELTGKLVTVHFGTENTDPSTKATLTPDAGETAFQAAWENGDVLSVYYINGNIEDGTVPATWNGSKFSAELPEYTGAWEYYAAYPVPDATDKHVDFGTNRTQKGNAYNSKYDIMVGKAVAQNAAAGKDDSGKDIVFEMDRQTAIAYFHFTSELDESLVSATLKVTDGAIANSAASISDFMFVAPLENDETEIKLTFEDGTAPSAKDFQLWFNVLPTSYSSMTLTVETDTKTFRISKSTDELGSYEAGKLYKVKKDGISWTDKPTTIFFYESFDKTIGTGGNDNNWSGNGVASATLTPDKEGWTFVKDNGANKCAKFGTSSALGSATTPSLGISTSKATLWFKAGAWAGDTAKQLAISIVGKGAVSPSQITLADGAWTEYFCTITGADADTKVQISATTSNKNRFFLDEVYVYSGPKPVVKANQIISFSKTSYSIFINDDFTEPTLSGAQTSVTYVSDNEKVVTVESTTGAITIVGAGTAKITATAEETEEYRSATASYTITVKDNSSSSPLILSNFSFEQAETVTITTNDNNISITAYKGNASTNPYNASGTIRLYQGDSSKYGGYITISAHNGVKIKSAVIESSSSYDSTTVASKVDSNAESDHITLSKSSSYTVPGIGEIGAESISIYCYGTTKNTRLEIAKITVIYE